MSDKKHAEVHHETVLWYALVGALPLVVLWHFWGDHRPSASSTMTAGVVMVIWLSIVFHVMEKEFALSSTNNRLTGYSPKTPTAVRDALIPMRGAVANIYRSDDLQDLIAHTHETVWRTLNRTETTLATEITAERFYKEHSDRIRADVLVGEYFLKKKSRPIQVVEPNLAQHIGFRSSEPGFHGIRLAMTATFEDGRLF